MLYLETQSTISEWGRRTFGKPRKEKIIARLNQEMSELVTVGLSGRREKGKREKVGEELADLYTLMCQVATEYNLDLHAAVDEKMRINRTRLWERGADGMFQHVRGT